MSMLEGIDFDLKVLQQVPGIQLGDLRRMSGVVDDVFFRWC